MKIALIGHGAMGRLIERLVVERGHQAFVAIDGNHSELDAAELALKIEGADVAIDFTDGAAVRRNVASCMASGIPMVEGTTGWNNEFDDVKKLVDDAGGGFVFGANFSIGVNLFYRVAEFAAELFAKFPQYEAFIEEQHHSRKRDAPSGTALKLKDVVSKHIAVGEIAATRAGNIPGTHRLGFDGPADQILLEHTARSREGFAAGAVLAAEWIADRSGFYEFTDVIGEISQRSAR